MSDVIYKNLTKEESIHLFGMATRKILSNKDIKILSEMQRVREIVEKAHAIRKEKAISVKQALLSFSTTEKPVSEILNIYLKKK